MTEVLIDPAVESACGLRYPSVASCNNLLTIDQGLIVQAIGSVSPATMQQVDDRLKTSLGLT
jgi:mRNA-degrading endonuclease toxin of MazEF toxin-antitoxin module